MPLATYDLYRFAARQRGVRSCAARLTTIRVNSDGGYSTTALVCRHPTRGAVAITNDDGRWEVLSYGRGGKDARPRRAVRGLTGARRRRRR